MEFEGFPRLTIDSLLDYFRRRKADKRDRREEFETSEEEEEEDESTSEEARVSRLFYLQLYSSVVKASEELRRKQKKKQKNKRRAKKNLRGHQTVSKVLQRSFSWMDVTSLLGRTQQQSLEERERDTGDSIKMVYHQRSLDQQRLTSPTVSSRLDHHAQHHSQPRQIQRQHHPPYQQHQQHQPPHSHTAGKRLEPVLNARMRNLSVSSSRSSPSSSDAAAEAANFSLRPRDDPAHEVVVTKTRECRLLDRALLCNALYIAAFTFCLVLCIIVLSSTSSSGSSYQTLYLQDPRPRSGPRISVCLPIPFSRSRLSAHRVPPPLAAFILYALSPFNPGARALEKNGETQEALSRLTAQFRSLLTSVSSAAVAAVPTSAEQERQPHRGELRRLFRALTPRCPQVVSSCAVGAARLDGDDCCRAVFRRAEFTLRHGLCFASDDLLSLSSAVAAFPASVSSSSLQEDFLFPINVPGAISRISFYLNGSDVATASLWSESATSSPPGFKIVLHPQRGGERPLASTVEIRAGQKVELTVAKRAVDNRRPVGALLAGEGDCQEEEEVQKVVYWEEEDDSSVPMRKRKARMHKLQQADCRSSAVQVICSGFSFRAVYLFVCYCPCVLQCCLCNCCFAKIDAAVEVDVAVAVAKAFMSLLLPFLVVSLTLLLLQLLMQPAPATFANPSLICFRPSPRSLSTAPC